MYKQSWFDTTPMQDWLYGSWSKEKLRQFTFYRNVPVLSQYMDYLLDLRDNEHYLDRNGMTYSDIKDPRKLSSVQSGSRLVGSAYSIVSKNVEKLYRDD